MQIYNNKSLKDFTTVGIGGKAKKLAIVDNNTDLINLIEKYYPHIFIIGRGSNLLISDDGFNGTVIINRANTIRKFKDKPSNSEILSATQLQNFAYVNAQKNTTVDIIEKAPYANESNFWSVDKTSSGFKGIDIDDFDDTIYPPGYVYADSGVMLPYFINYTLDKGLTGLQWFARIPGTIGGAIYNNIHGAKHLFSEYIDKVVVFNLDRGVYVLDKQDCNFGYDFSRFKQTNEFIIGALFKLYRGDTDKAKHIAQMWIQKKSIQPQNSPGCAFVNITYQDKERLQIPTVSTGYVIDQLLHMKGYRIGDAQVYEHHANFVVNLGNAKFKDYLRILKDIYDKALDQFNLELHLEIQILTENGLITNDWQKLFK